MIPEFSEPEEEIDEVCKNINSGRKSHHLLGVNYMPDTVLNALLSFDSHNDPIGRSYHYPHFPMRKLGSEPKSDLPKDTVRRRLGS